MAKIKRKKRRAAPPESARAQEATAQTDAPVDTAAEEAPAKAGRTSGQFQDVEAVIEADMIPYLVWREWWKARDRGDFDFLYELSAPDSPLREHFGPADEFGEVCRRKMRPVLGTTEGQLFRIRLHGEDEAYVVQAIDLKARERRDYDAERWFMLRGDGGWRVHQIDRITLPKDRAPNTLTLDDFPDVTFPPGVAPANG